MLSASSEFRNRIAENSKTLFKATLTLADGTVRNIVGDDVMMASATFSDAVSSSGSFDVGAAIINQFEVELNNFDGRFDEYDFTDAAIVPYIGVELSGGVEWILKGHYGVEQPESYGATIGISALDNMRKFERPYSDVGTVYPASLGTIVRDICAICGVTLLDADFANSSYVVGSRPDDSSLTCLSVLSYAAQASGNFARCDVNGNLAVTWYNTDFFERENWLDGEAFDDDSPYSSGSTADGGNFTNYGSGDSVEGGEFGWNTFASLFAVESMAVATDDVVITGISVTAQDLDADEADEEQDTGGETSLYGNQGYVLSISGNPLVEYGKAATVAAQVGARVVGMRFRPFDLSAIGDPLVEAGDPAIIIDRKQNQYRSYVTSLKYKVGNYEAFSCNAETPSRNKADSYSAITAAIVQNRNRIKKEESARQLAVKRLARELSESSGVYLTEDEQDDGSIIYYLHDKKELSDSRIVWKLTAEAFGVSTDGGRTYPFGFDAWGMAILNSIYTIGLDATYIDSGAITIRDPLDPTKYVFRADFDTKQVEIDAPSVLIGTRKAFADDDSSVTINSGTVMFNSNTFVVNSTNFSVTSTGLITATGGTIGGFNITANSLYYGQSSSLSATGQGVYIGTQGIMTSDGAERLVMRNGSLFGYQLANGSNQVCELSPTATVNEVNSSGNATGAVWRGMQIVGGILDIRTTKIAVLDKNNKTDTSHLAMNKTLDMYVLESASETSSHIKLVVERFKPQFCNGILIGCDMPSSEEFYFAPKDHNHSADDITSGTLAAARIPNLAIGKITNLQTTLNGKAASNHTHSGYALTNHTHSEYAASDHTHSEYAASDHTHSEYAASDHTHSYSSLTGKPSIPTFELDDTTLYITA